MSARIAAALALLAATHFPVSAPAQEPYWPPQMAGAPPRGEAAPTDPAPAPQEPYWPPQMAGAPPRGEAAPADPVPATPASSAYRGTDVSVGAVAGRLVGASGGTGAVEIDVRGDHGWYGVGLRVSAVGGGGTGGAYAVTAGPRLALSRSLAFDLRAEIGHTLYRTERDRVFDVTAPVYGRVAVLPSLGARAGVMWRIGERRFVTAGALWWRATPVAAYDCSGATFGPCERRVTYGGTTLGAFLALGGTVASPALPPR